MIIREVIAWLLNELSHQYDERECHSVTNLLLEKSLEQSPSQFLANQDMEVKDEQELQLNVWVSELKKGIPVQYVLGETEFYGIKLQVNPSVLIPRGETEELVEWILEDQMVDRTECLVPGAEDDGLRILDIGTGSGAIAIALAANIPGAKAIACDISEDTLTITRENWENLKLTTSELSVSHLDVLKNKAPGTRHSAPFDIIVSNPPYIMESQRDDIHARVKEQEPVEALFVPDDDPLVFYRAIAVYAKENLAPDGAVYLEINDLLGKETVSLLQSFFNFVELRKDIHGRDRMIKASNGPKKST